MNALGPSMLRARTRACQTCLYPTGISPHAIRTRFTCSAHGPAHEFFCSRKLRLAPQDYSPWTPPLDRLLVRSSPASAGGGRVTAPSIDRTLVRDGGHEHRDSRVSRRWRVGAAPQAVQRRGPGRVVLGSKPQLATTEKLVRWAVRATGQKTRALGSTRELGCARDCPNHLLFLFCLRAARA